MNEKVEVYRRVIKEFIDARREDRLKPILKKMEKEEDELKRHELSMDADKIIQNHDYSTWLIDRTRGMEFTRIATHIPKAAHPDSSASSFLMDFSEPHESPDVSTATLGEVDYFDAICSTAEYLPAAALASLRVNSDPLFSLTIKGDMDLYQALLSLIGNEAQTYELWSSLKGVTGKLDTISTDALSKQVYFLISTRPSNDGSYHLLQPMSSSILMQNVHDSITESIDKNGINKIAREAKKKSASCEHPFIEYRGLALTKLGGSNPRNISMLNNKRRGRNYLLSAAPPQWKSRSIPQLRKDENLWRTFYYFGSVRDLIDELVTFLLTDPPPNRHTRNRRDVLVQAIGAWLTKFMEEVRASAKPGWTQADDCELTACLKLWLEPSFDPVAYDRGDWPDQVAGLFANWLERRLRKGKGGKEIIGLGDPEYLYLARQAVIEAAWPVPMQRRAAPVETEELA